MLNTEMQNAVKDTMSVIIAESTGKPQKEVRTWLDTVKTAEDFFGPNKVGLNEYNNFIRARETAYANAQKRRLSRV